MDIDMVTN